MEIITIEDKKRELLAWLKETKDTAAIEKLYAEKQAITFDFEKEFARGYTLEEAKKIASEKINQWWGK